MVKQTPPVVCLIGTSNSGKTTLLTRLIKILKQRGFRVGTIKHHLHSFDIDHEGKDSWRHQQAGADATVITAPSQTALIKKTDSQMDPGEIISHYLKDMDLVFIEGFKHSSFPKIEVHRQAQRSSLIWRGEKSVAQLIAVVSDRQWDIDVPVFPLEAADKLIDFIINYFKIPTSSKPRS
ncbi:MAG: molybdopterin-guanine dinucleotide biosynthesis protein B [Deltaproteobacteria bacterium]|nr:MAG: molybdopterin-guanine dinucleotide biosynthesis protein B [Deltaproteobacteria bacterium]